MGALSESLEDSRIDGVATRVYLALLRMERPSRELLLAQGLPAATLATALAILEDRGLITVGPTGALHVPPPMTSIPHHALDLERRAQRVRAAAHELAQVYYDARTRDRDPETGVTVLHDLDAVGTQSNLMVAAARTSIVSTRAMTERTRELVHSPLESHREPSVGVDGQTVGMRTVWDSQVLELPGAVDALAARVEGGESQRFLARVPLTVLVVDRSVCLMEWSSVDQRAPQGLVLRTDGMVHSLLALADRLWTLATPMSRGSNPTELEGRDAAILRLMTAGSPDASIARQLGVSQRTVERRIRSLMDRLGSRTRFQAGVQAVHRGWL
jgi:DNA-binding CsgD family transcriptional regulator